MSGTISGQTNMNGAASIDRTADFVEITDSSGPTTYKATPDFILGFTGGNPVSTTDTQTLTNKTLTSPTISSPTLSGTLIGTYTIGGTPTFPSSVVTLTGSQTLTNKTLTSPTINTPTITNPTVTIDTISEFTSANGVSIDGLNIKDGALNTNNSVPNNAWNNTGAFGSSWAWTSWTPTWTNLTVGNGTLTAKYNQIGKTVFFHLELVLGTTTSISGSVSLTLPITSVGTYKTQSKIGDAIHFDASGQINGGAIFWTTTTTGTVYALGAGSTWTNYVGISSTDPFTWTSTDRLLLTGYYEVA